MLPHERRKMNSVKGKIVYSSVLGTLALAAMLFIPAGTLDYWQGWVYLGTFVLASGLYTLYLTIHDPALLQRRMQAGPSQEKEPAQKIIIILIYTAFFALGLLSPLDLSRFSVKWRRAVFR